MSYKSIKVPKLKEDLNDLAAHLNYSAIDNALDDFAGNNYWQANVKSKFRKELEQQIDTYYADLKNKINEFLLIADYINDWQQTNKEISDLKIKRDDAKSKIYTQKERKKKDNSGNYMMDIYGNYIYETYSAYSSYWNDQYQKYVQKIKTKEQLLKQYEIKITELLKEN